jgi:hypothetical protein
MADLVAGGGVDRRSAVPGGEVAPVREPGDVAGLGTVALVGRGWRRLSSVTTRPMASVFAGFRFPPEVISVAVRWYLRYGLSYRDVEELVAERGITVDHVSVYRWVQRFTPEFIGGCEAVPPRSRGPVVRRRDGPEGRRPMDLSLPGGRPAWPGHRRLAGGPARAWPPPGASSPGRCAPAWSRSRSAPAARRSACGSSMSWFSRPGTPVSSMRTTRSSQTAGG